jgi:hypothetical protein
MAGGAGGVAWGGGLGVIGGSLTMSKSTVAYNQVNGGTGGMGGLGSASSLGGQGGGGGVGGAAQGGGIFISSPTVSLSTSTVSNNTVIGGNGGTGGNGHDGFSIAGSGGAGGDGGVGQGAGLYVSGGQATITNATIALNAAIGGIGGTGGQGGNIAATTVGTAGRGGDGGNGAASAGGGIYLDAGTLNLTNATIASNQAAASTGGAAGAGGMGVHPGTSGSPGSGQAGQGGGAWVAPAGTTVDAINTLFGENQAGTAPDFSGNFTKASHNFLEDGTGSNLAPGDPDSTGNIVGTSAHPINPMLGPLAKNGGPTYTMALLAGSPCLNAGTSTGAPAKDQRGVTRDTPPDIGAFELETRGLSVRSNAVVKLETRGMSVQTAVVDSEKAGASVRSTAVGDPSDLTVRIAALDALLAEGTWTRPDRSHWH